MTAYPAPMAEVDADPDQKLADNGYDGDAARQDIQDRGCEPVIPTKANRKQQINVQKAIYGLRNRIERFFNRLKNSWRVATRYDKLIQTFAAFVLLATLRNWHQICLHDLIHIPIQLSAARHSLLTLVIRDATLASYRCRIASTRVVLAEIATLWRTVVSYRRTQRRSTVMTGLLHV